MLRLPLRSILLCCLVLDFLCRPGVSGAQQLPRACRRLVRMLGGRVRLRGPGLPLADRGLVVLNHLSWLDPVLLGAQGLSAFVTSREVAADPLLGRVCRRAGCVFVERRSARAAGREQRALVAGLRKGPLTVFPEATSSCGDGVLPFKPAFFESARLARVPVQALALRYRRVDGRRLGRRSRDRLHWYGSMPFAPHLLRLLAGCGFQAELWALPARPWRVGADRKAMATSVQTAIARAHRALRPAAGIAPQRRHLRSRPCRPSSSTTKPAT